MAKQLYKAGDSVTLRADDGSVKSFKIESIFLGGSNDLAGQAVVTLIDENGDTIRVLGTRMYSALTEKVESPSHRVVESSGMSDVVCKNQLVRVYKAGTQDQVDTGLVSEVTSEAIFVAGEEYKRADHEFLILA